MATQFVISNHSLVVKATTLRKTRFFLVKYNTWLKNMDAPLHNSRLHGLFIKLIIWYLSLVRARLPFLSSSFPTVLALD